MNFKVNLGSFGPTEVLFIFSVGGSVMIACFSRRAQES